MRRRQQKLPAALLAIAIALVHAGCRNEQIDMPAVEPTLTATNERPSEAPVPADIEEPQTEDDGRVKTITFDDLKLEIDKGALFEESMLTPEIEALVGRRISIRGFMYSTYQSKGIEQFVLLQRKDCPFGTPEAYVHHAIYVKLKDGVTTSFTRDPVTVAGVLSVGPQEGSPRG